MKSGHEILEELLTHAAQMPRSSTITNEMEDRLNFVCTCQVNRATVRLLMACLLAKIHHPIVDPRKPYTEIGGEDSFSGRSYDETYRVFRAAC